MRTNHGLQTVRALVGGTHLHSFVLITHCSHRTPHATTSTIHHHSAIGAGTTHRPRLSQAVRLVGNVCGPTHHHHPPTHTRSRATTSLHTREERLQSKARRYAMNSHAMGMRPSGRGWLGSECGAERDRQLVAQANTNQQKCCSATMAAHMHTRSNRPSQRPAHVIVRAHAHAVEIRISTVLLCNRAPTLPTTHKGRAATHGHHHHHALHVLPHPRTPRTKTNSLTTTHPLTEKS